MMPKSAATPNVSVANIGDERRQKCLEHAGAVMAADFGIRPPQLTDEIEALQTAELAKYGNQYCFLDAKSETMTMG
jgi:hypothetical protein